MQIGWDKAQSQLELSLAQLSPSLFSDIVDVYSGPIEQIDMILSESCQTPSDTSLEYQQRVVWLQMVHIGPERQK